MKLKLGRIILLFFCSVIFFTGIAFSEDKSCDIMSGEPQVKRLQDSRKPKNAVAGKLWWHPERKMYIRQIVVYNDTSKDMITKEIYDYVMSLKPTKCTDEENYGYKLWPDGSEEFDFKKFK